jgi:sugar phosphate isomerase/epimerase
MLSITTDYARSTGDPSPYLRRIANAGFSHVHWCHQWNTDFLYAKSEVTQIAAWLKEYGLSLLDLHGSVGPEKHWAAAEEYRRVAGVKLVRNRLEMTARLGADVVIMHAGRTAGPAGTAPGWDSLRRSLEELEPCARKLGVRIAIENGEWLLIHELLCAYPPDFIGLCYDSGHGNIDGGGLSELASTKDRLISIHLHDNSGTADEHRLPFSGTVDWARLATILSSSAYTKCISMESNMGKERITSEEEFLARAFAAGSRLSAMVSGIRSGRQERAPNRPIGSR